jgi:hypothetical protein
VINKPSGSTSPAAGYNCKIIAPRVLKSVSSFGVSSLRLRGVALPLQIMLASVQGKREGELTEESLDIFQRSNTSDRVTHNRDVLGSLSIREDELLRGICESGVSLPLGVDTVVPG